MKRVLLAVLVVACLGLVGCSANTVSEIKSNPAASKSTTVNKSLVETFEAMQRIHEEDMPYSRCILLPSRGECILPGNGGTGYHYYAEMTPLDSATTKVDFYFYSNLSRGTEAQFDKMIQRLHGAAR